MLKIILYFQRKYVIVDLTKKVTERRSSMVRLELTFELVRQEFPLEYDRLLVSFFKATLQNYSREMFDALYNKNASIQKQFCWSCNLSGARFETDKIYLKEKRFKLYFSDADMTEIIQFYNAFTLMKGKKYPMPDGNMMDLSKVRVCTFAEIQEEELIVKMQSSLLARRHDVEKNQDTYYTCEDAEFSEVIKENVTTFLQKQGIELSTETFQVTPVKGRKVVVRCFGRFCDGSIGIFRITGSKELLNLLYVAGIGARRSEGHGLWTILG